MPALQRPAPPAALVEALKAANVPVESFADACAACEDACDDHDEDLQYPSGFEVDLDSQMLGELKPYGRQILVSTGKSEWIREVTDDEKSIPGLVKAEYEKVEKANGGAGKDGLFAKLGNKVFGSGASEQKGKEVEVPGVHPTAANPPPGTTVSSRLSILSASFISSSHHGHRESVISLPDFKVINEVEATPASVEELVTRYLEPSVGRAGSSSVKGELQSWPLPYNCVILLCSHRKRDKRCSIAAPLLISQFHHHLEKHGLHVDERGDDLAHGPPIEEWEGTEEEKEVRLRETLQGVKTDGGSVGLFKISHIGGHRYAGNVILYFPNGTSVWFGRVTPADVGVIVDRTIMQGKIIPELLRGGLGLSGKNGPKGVLDW